MGQSLSGCRRRPMTTRARVEFEERKIIGYEFSSRGLLKYNERVL